MADFLTIMKIGFKTELAGNRVRINGARALRTAAVHGDDQPTHDRTNFLEEILMSAPGQGRPPFPPFTRETAAQKARAAEDAWNSRDPERVSLAYTEDSTWRNHAEFFSGRPAITEVVERKWPKEPEYRLIKEAWAFEGARIAVRFAYEWRDDSGHWSRSYGNENWEFDELGLMKPVMPASMTW